MCQRYFQSTATLVKLADTAVNHHQFAEISPSSQVPPKMHKVAIFAEKEG